MGLHTPRFPLLQELGLSANEALLYEILLKKGPTKPSDLVEPSGLGRGNVYNVLQQLTSSGFVLLRDQGKFQTYEAVSPSELDRLLQQKQDATKRLEQSFLATLPQLASVFNLSTGKPTIQIFEGLDGIERVLEDSLTAQGEILTIADPDAITGPILQIESVYIRKRIAQKIHKRVLLPDTATAREWLKEPGNGFTESRICPSFMGGFCAALEIYDTRLSLITLRGKQVVSLLIRDESLAALQRAQFEALWLSTQP